MFSVAAHLAASNQRALTALTPRGGPDEPCALMRNDARKIKERKKPKSEALIINPIISQK